MKIRVFHMAYNCKTENYIWISIDLDLSGTLKVDNDTFITALAPFKKVIVLKKSTNINISSIDGVKVDFVNYSYPWIGKIKIEDNLRLAALKDIAAMKLAAATGRGTKKDFIDIYFLLQIFKLSEMIEFYKTKYSDGSEFLVLKSMTYFEDAELEQEPKMINNISWNGVKQTIIKKHSEYLKRL